MEQNRFSDEEYKKILESMPVCCVDLVIVWNNKVLVIYRKNKPDKIHGAFREGESIKMKN